MSSSMIKSVLSASGATVYKMAPDIIKLIPGIAGASAVALAVKGVQQILATKTDNEKTVGENIKAYFADLCFNRKEDPKYMDCVLYTIDPKHPLTEEEQELIRNAFQNLIEYHQGAKEYINKFFDYYCGNTGEEISDSFWVDSNYIGIDFECTLYDDDDEEEGDSIQESKIPFDKGDLTNMMKAINATLGREALKKFTTYHLNPKA